MGLALFAPMLERVQELRINTRQASQVLSVYLIGLALIGIDEPQFASTLATKTAWPHSSSTLLTQGE